MSQSKTFQQTLAELNTIHRRVYLRIPTPNGIVEQQIKRLALAQEQLDQMTEKVFLLFGRGGSSSNFLFYLSLKGLIQTMSQTAKMFQLLAEEYLLDPEGALACLQDTDNQYAQIRQYIHTLQTAETPQRLLTLCRQEHS